MTISRIPQALHYAALIALFACGLAMTGCDEDTGTISAAPSTDDNTLPPARPMLEAGAGAAPGTTPVSSIKVAVKLSPALAKQASAHDAVFIFARPAQGSRMPLAIVRKQVKDLPVTVTLDDSLAMLPEQALSGVAEVVVGARISKSGDAIAQPGDLEGYSPPVRAGSRIVEVTIAEIHTGQTNMPANHPMGETGTESDFVHPKSTQTSTLRIPAEVKAKWKSVELSITAAGGKEQRTRVSIGDKVAVANTGLSLSVTAYVPAFMSDAGVVTSSSNHPDNPAVQLQLSDGKGKIAEGWVFQSLPDFNSFSSNKVSVRLLSAQAR
jgi:hypothetical protein